jgi:ribosomal protein L19
LHFFNDIFTIPLRLFPAAPSADTIFCQILTFVLGRRKIRVIPPPPTALSVCKDPVAAVAESQLAILDPAGERKALFDYRRNPKSVKVGDILRVTFKSGDPFSGVCLSIRLRGSDTSFLLRNQLTRVGVEMWIKVFSPNVQSVEIVQRTVKRKRRARLYYMRFVHTLTLKESYLPFTNKNLENLSTI